MNADRRRACAALVEPILVVALEALLTRCLEGAAFVPGDRVSEAKGDPIDSALLFPVGERRRVVCVGTQYSKVSV